MSHLPGRGSRRFVVLGEDYYDARALAELLRALCPGAVVKPLRQPIRLRRGAHSQAVSVIEEKVLPVLQAELAAHGADCIFLHVDCDDIEPADSAIAERISRQLQGTLPVTVHAVVPAWELEAWWFLWPEACVQVSRAWRLPDRYAGRQVGRIRNAKEELRRALRSGRSSRGIRQYEPSDAPAIAAAVRKLGIVHRPQAESAAFARFKQAAENCCA